MEKQQLINRLVNRKLASGVAKEIVCRCHAGLVNAVQPANRLCGGRSVPRAGRPSQR